MKSCRPRPAQGEETPDGDGSLSRSRIIIVAWGERYIATLNNLTLPVLSAQGNIPYLARRSELDVVFLTSRSSIPLIKETESVRRLCDLCPVHYLEIDDLIVPGHYGVTLTLAFARGIRDLGEAQTEASIYLMNADFIANDGALATTASRLEEGARCILAGSVRVNAEEVSPLLTSMVGPDRVLALSSRSLARITLDHPHPTVIAKTMTQDILRCSVHNQLYWRVTSDCFLSRNHLSFPLAIRPERQLEAVTSYCDYGFVPEMVPSGSIHVVGDSDEVFLMELQARRQEMELIACGSDDPRRIASELGSWTTEHHRRQAEFDIVIHAGELPDRLPDVRATADAFIRDVHRLMPPPFSHHHHPYWMNGVTHWNWARGSGAPPPELGGAEKTNAYRNPVRDLFRGALNRLKRVFGRFPSVPPWHHLWLEGGALRRWLDEEPIRNGLLVRGGLEALAVWASSRPNFKTARASFSQSNEAESTIDPVPPPDHFDTVLLHCSIDELPRARATLGDLVKTAVPGGRLGVLVSNSLDDPNAREFSRQLPESLGNAFSDLCLKFEFVTLYVGSETLRRSRAIERRLLSWAVPSSFLRIPLSATALLCLPLIGLANLASNLSARAKRPAAPERFVSCALVTWRRPGDEDPRP